MNNRDLPSSITYYVITNMNDMSNYTRILSQYHYITQDQERLFLNSVDELEELSDKWQNGQGRCLSRSDIEVLYNLGNLLVNNSINRYFVSNSIYGRLAKFWLSVKQIPDDRVAVIVTGQKPDSKVPIPLDLDKIYVARENTNLMINTVVERNYSSNNNLLILDIPTILLTIIIRSEAHEYALSKILDRIKEVTKNQIDIPDLLSVEAKVSKISKGQLEYKPDTRAIRDATAHAKFKIESDSAGDFPALISCSVLLLISRIYLLRDILYG
jgi:hypothetical protein